MRKSLVIGILLALLTFPGLVFGQGIPGYSPPMAPIIGNQAPMFGPPVLGGAPATADIWVGNTRVRPSVRAGYERVSLGFNVPIGVSAPFNFEQVDMKFDSVDSAVGSIGVLAESLSGWAAFVQLSGNLARDFTADFEYTGDVDVPYESPWEWSDSNLDKWWGEVGVSYRVYTGLGLICGMRFDRIDAAMQDPRNNAGSVPQDYAEWWWRTNFGFDFSVLRDNSQADMQVKLYTPFIGIGGGGYNYRWHVIGSLFGWGNAAMPIRLITDYELRAGGGGLLLAETINTDNRYTLDISGGRFLRGDVEYRYNVANNMALGGWVSVATYGWNGTGRMEANTASTLANPTLYQGVAGEAEAGDSKFWTFTLAGGAMVTLVY